MPTVENGAARTELFDPRTEPKPVDMLQVIAAASANPEVDVEKLERLLAIREKELARIAENEFHVSMRECQAEIPLIFRDAVNEHNRSRYARLETVNDRVVPVYTRHGFSLSFGTAETPLEGFIRLTCRVSHIGGHSRDYQADLPLDGAGAKGNANKTGVQAFGSTVSYGRRYLTLLIFNVTLTNEDVDGRIPGERPDGDPDAPKVAPRAQRKAEAAANDELTHALTAAYKLWCAERAGTDRGWPAFFAWAEKVTDTKDLNVKANWTLEMARKCEEACR